MEFLTQHLGSPWLWMAIALIVSCIVSQSIRPVRYAALGAIAMGLLWLFTWVLHNDALVYTRHLIADWWAEVSVAFGVAMTFVPAIGYTARAVIAVPVAWICVLIWQLIFEIVDNLIVGPLLGYLLPVAGNLSGIYGNMTNIIVFICAAQIIGGRFKLIVGLIASAFTVIIELALMNSRYHECGIVPVFFPNPELTWWQWTNFGLSLALIAFILYFTVKDVQEERGSRSVGDLLWG